MDIIFLMLFSILRSFIILTFLHSRPVFAWWILGHSSLTTDRLDPIVNPGQVSSHVHTIVGASNFGPIVSTESLQASKCTTSPVQDDMSNYWAPQLYHRDTENGSLTLIPIAFVNTYYLQREDSKNKTISAFPPGLRMIAGDPARTTYNDSDTTNKAVDFVCLDYSGTSSSSSAFPTQNCPSGMRAQIVFPSCWDGKNIDSEDHKSHMSYPEGSNPDNGDCPSSHPVKLVTLFHEWVFSVDKFEFKAGQKNWVFSHGDDVGYGFHADFVSGWKTEVLQAAIEQCTDSLFNNVEGCPPFVASINRSVAEDCTIDSVVEEDIGRDHAISALPGCNPIPTDMDAKCPSLTTPEINGTVGTGGSTTIVPSSSGSVSPTSSGEISSAGDPSGTSSGTTATLSASYVESQGTTTPPLLGVVATSAPSSTPSQNASSGSCFQGIEQRRQQGYRSSHKASARAFSRAHQYRYPPGRKA